MEQQGIYVAADTLRFERTLPGPIEKVWAYLTESDKRGLWLAKGDLELVEGGKVELIFFHQELSPVHGPVPEKFKNMGRHSFTGKVVRIEAPHVLAFTWEGGSEVTFELKKEEELVKLTVTHRKLTPGQGGVAPGWHTHLDILLDKLKGGTPGNFWTSYFYWDTVYSK